jgi:glycosyltransferase involved in cell wall biosynthesis
MNALLSSHIVIAIGGLWLLCFAVQMFYYFYFYLRIARKKKILNTEQPTVSVIVCAKNEEENLKQFLPSVLEQDYPNYEVIVVNDCSEDESANVLEEFSKKYHHLRISTIKKDEKFSHGKKLALTIGIKAAEHEHLLFTDADCYPISPSWISGMMSSYNPETELVLGYGGYTKEKGFLNKIIRFDSLFIAMQYMGFAFAGTPYMGVGRNLSYKKNVFFKNKGFARHAILNSGDDDLFVSETAHKNNVGINVEEHTRSKPKNTFAIWLFQKKRHQSTFALYKTKHKFLLVLEPISRFFFYFIIPALLLLDIHTWIFVVPVFAIRLIVLIVAFYFSTKTLKEQDLLLISPLFDFLFLFVELIIKITKKPQRQLTWK